MGINELYALNDGVAYVYSISFVTTILSIQGLIWAFHYPVFVSYELLSESVSDEEKG